MADRVRPSVCSCRRLQQLVFNPDPAWDGTTTMEQFIPLVPPRPLHPLRFLAAGRPHGPQAAHPRAPADCTAGLRTALVRRIVARRQDEALLDGGALLEAQIDLVQAAAPASDERWHLVREAGVVVAKAHSFTRAVEVRYTCPPPPHRPAAPVQRRPLRRWRWR